jgi:hypothetical protein
LKCGLKVLREKSGVAILFELYFVKLSLLHIIVEENSCVFQSENL